MTDVANTESAEIDRPTAWRAAVRHSLAHAREDLARSRTAEVILARHALPSTGMEFLDELERDAAAQSFVCARAAVFAGKAFDTFEGLVRAVGRSVRAPGHAGEGVANLLAVFAAQHKRDGLAVFDRGAADFHAAGDLISLARAFLDSKRQPARELARIEAWLQGTELVRAEAQPVALGALSPRTAKRSLAEISVLVRALGWRGLVVIFEDAEVITKLPPGRRENAYTVLRELIDNTDTARGLVSTQVLVTGLPPLFEGRRSIESLAPLALRVRDLTDATGAWPPPHRPRVDLDPPAGWDGEGPRVDYVAPPAPSVAELRAIIRGAQGVPPLDPSVTMTVGYEQIDATITSMFEHSANQGSVFTLLVGPYGSGKTHLLGHLTARSLADRRPVLRLSLERLDSDLGSPQRHLRRLLEYGTLPLPHRPTPLDRLVAWTRSPLHTRRMLTFLDEVAASGADSASAARRVLRSARGDRAALVIERFFSGHDLEQKASSRSSRVDAYTRVLLWFAMLERLEGCAGPVLVIDEAENLYRGGTSRAERRTALRSLSFYCGGTLPRACVVMAITPDALARLRDEGPALLDEIAAHKGTLSWEDAQMLKRRLSRTRPTAVPTLPGDLRAVLAFRVREAHASVRGKIPDRGFASFVEQLVATEISPRETIRRVIDRLERAAFRAG